jgi:hypothetical protein
MPQESLQGLVKLKPFFLNHERHYHNNHIMGLYEYVTLNIECTSVTSRNIWNASNKWLTKKNTHASKIHYNKTKIKISIHVLLCVFYDIPFYLEDG